jgi:ornithine cyclodeaminase
VSEASFIYLSQEDAVKYGAGDVAATVNDTERTIVLTYRGQATEAPTATLFWDIPEENRGSKFGYLSKKRANIHAGFIDDDGVRKLAIKNIPSNPDNPANGRGPRASGLVTILDPDTGYPLAVMDAMVISCMRTGALGSIGVKHLRSSKARSACVIGAGPIGQAALLCTAEVMPELEQAFIVDMNPARAALFAENMTKRLGIPVTVADSAQAGVSQADVVIPATNVQDASAAYIEYSWLKKGATLIDLSLWDFKYEVFEKADAMFTNSDLVMERKTMTPAALVAQGVTTEDKLVDIGGVIEGKVGGRKNDDEIIVYFARGMALYDVMTGYRVYENAKAAMGGQNLSLWKSEFWF